MPEFTFITREWNRDQEGYVTLIHRATSVTLSSDGDHNIPSGFRLYARCGSDATERGNTR